MNSSKPAFPFTQKIAQAVVFRSALGNEDKIRVYVPYTGPLDAESFDKIIGVGRASLIKQGASVSPIHWKVKKVRIRWESDKMSQYTEAGGPAHHIPTANLFVTHSEIIS